MANIPAYMRIRNYAIDLISKSPDREEKLLSERELCKVFKVSRTTVRNALKDLTQEGFLTSLHGKGTFTNPKKAPFNPFQSRNCYSIGIIWANGKCVYYSHHSWNMINSCAQVVVNNGHLLRFLNLAHSNEDIVREIELLNIDGIIWMLPPPEAAGIIDALKTSGIATVAVNRSFDRKDINYVKLNTFSYGYLGASRLLQDGHKKIIYAALANEKETERAMYEGFIQAHKDFGIEYDQRLALNSGKNLRYDFGKMIELGIDFSAVMAHGTYLNDVIYVINEKNIRIPQDMTILGDDDTLKMAKKDYYPRMIEPIDKVCNSASQMLLDILDKKINSTKQKEVDPFILTNNNFNKEVFCASS